MSIKKLTVKIEGSWNTRIFQPEWLIKNILESTNISKKPELNLLFNLDKRQLGFIFEGISILPTEDYLEFVVDEKKLDNEDLIKTTVRIMTKILKLLPQTPITSINFNISYLIENNQTKYYKLFELYNNLIGSFKIEEYKLVKKSEEYFIYILVTLLSNKNININFTYTYNKFRDFKEDIFLNHIKETKELIE